MKTLKEVTNYLPEVNQKQKS